MLSSTKLLKEIAGAVLDVKIVSYKPGIHKHLNTSDWTNDDSIASALLMSPNPRRKVLVAVEDDNSIVGAIAYGYDTSEDIEGMPDTVKLPKYIMYVSHIGSTIPGTGRALMNVVTEEAQKRNLVTVLAYAGISKGFYERLGFTTYKGMAWLFPTLMESEDEKKWIGCDLDGTLAEYTTWKGDTDIGDPIPAMLKKVKEKLDAGVDVRIFTARVAHDEDGKIEKAIKAWCKEHIGQELPVTNEKDQFLEEIWDDRARRVTKNKGVFEAKEHVHEKCRKCGTVQSCRCRGPKRIVEVDECWACKNPDMALPWR